MTWVLFSPGGVEQEGEFPPCSEESLQHQTMVSFWGQGMRVGRHRLGLREPARVSCWLAVVALILFKVLHPDSLVTKAQSSYFLSHELLQRGSWLPICSFTSPSVLDFCSFPFLFLPHPQIPQDSPEQEASKSPRGAVPVSTEASLPPEATPQLSLQSTTPIANYSQVSSRDKDRSLTAAEKGKRRRGGMCEWKSKVVRREGIVKMVIQKQK